MTDLHPPRKRRRPAHSCIECRRRKVKCDRARPSCAQCRALDLTAACAYDDNSRGSTQIRPSPRQYNERETNEQTDDQSRASAIEITPQNSTASSGGIRGTISKTRVFGNGHWMNTFSLMEGLSTLDPIHECFHAFSRIANGAPSDEVADTVSECKRLSQTIKRHRPSRRALPADLHNSLPSRDLIDALIQIYFTTFESCYGILDYSSFMAEYMASSESAESADRSFLLVILLVVTVTGPLHDEASVRSEMAAKARTSIDIAQAWLSAPLEKDRLSLRALQVHCLLLLSRQINQVGADLVWISAGSLLRMAMQMGLHQDPDLLGQMDTGEKNLRRRLWYTMIEMNLHAAIDAGMPPMVTNEDFNTKPPSEVDDRSHTNFQAVLAKSLSLRIRATRVINSMQDEPAYDQVLELGNQLASACSEAVRAIAQCTSTTGFASSFCSHLLRRFPLSLHYRYAIRAKPNPLYSHSRHACLEAALDLVSLLEDNIYGRVLVTGGGMFRDLITRGALVIFLELSPDTEADASIFAKRRNRARQEPLLQDARRVVQYAKDRYDASPGGSSA
ncbi:putative C6 transcription factor [Aspergillus mulundensis]|uniref:Zn(2)-C6 fungal-type domain-containing protein n=1 Tax=Aspergillus mulundensis TaxID=1810919 RepID=A0A3D8S577_9EURO|nr:Uncharacterized protein DSM5745_04818 [Aspergillus mulundensis]RDW81261.1 Uncharacterized protein DSM5745_04818 [Aspergillus mulundensis]